MSKSLSDLVTKAEAELRAVDNAVGAALAGSSSKVTERSVKAIQRALLLRGEVEHCAALLQARTVASSYLDGLEGRADPKTRMVDYGSSEVPFDVARLLGVQSYLSVVWSVSDKISAVSAGFLCVSGGGLRARDEVNLLKTFMTSENAAPSPLWHSLRTSFGWPICIAYGARNLFVHTAGGEESWNFFEGNEPAAGFAISEKGWRYLEEKYQGKASSLEPTMTRAPEQWPWHKDDFRKLMDICVREMDVALGVILMTACAAAKQHVGLLLE
jgi:hypothetical protein